MTDPIKPTLPCDHPIEERLHWKIPKNLHIEWCEECGAYRDNKGIEHDGGYNAWQLPNRRTPPPAAVLPADDDVSQEADRYLAQHWAKQRTRKLAAPAPAQTETGNPVSSQNDRGLSAADAIMDIADQLGLETGKDSPQDVHDAVVRVLNNRAQTVTDAMVDAAFYSANAFACISACSQDDFWYSFHGRERLRHGIRAAIEAALAAGEG